DGSTWSVIPDPEATTGLVNDMFAIEKLPPDNQQLRERFKMEPLFLEVVDMLLNTDTNTPVCNHMLARHRAKQYILHNGKLWRLYGGTSVWPHHKVGCITREEAEERAKHLHETGGHWGRDALKTTLTDHYHSPKLDLSIMKAIQA
ncbi:hypothetical protein SCLCIDRAFT_73302, partial [Scleroderma citrinum Foug A]